MINEKLNKINSILKQYLFDTFYLKNFHIDVINESNVVLTDINNKEINISNYFNEITLIYDDVEEKLQYKNGIDNQNYWVVISKNDTSLEKDFC